MTAGKQPPGKGSVRSRGREEFWRRIVRGQPDSGMSIRQWCQRNRVAEPSFYAWRRELARRDAKPDGSALARRGATSQPRHDSSPRFVAMHVADSSKNVSSRSPLQLLVNDVRIEIGPGFDGDTLRRLLSLLREAATC